MQSISLPSGVKVRDLVTLSFIAFLFVCVIATSFGLKRQNINNVEAAQEFTGVLTKYIEDDFDTRKSKDHFTLVDASHKIYRLTKLKSLPKNAKLGDTVKLTGSLNNDTFKINSGTIVSSGKTGNKTSGQVKARVFPIKFTNYQSSNLTTAEINNVLQGANNPISLKNFMNKVSKGRFGISDVLIHDWFIINSNNLSNQQICDLYDMDEIVEYLNTNFDTNVYDSAYQSLIFVVDHPCFTRSMAAGRYESGQASVYIVPDHFSEGVLAHEIGHNLGLHHANSYSCNDKMYDTLANCESLEYGSPFSVMGHDDHDSLFREFSGAERVRLGWVNSSEIMQVSATGTYTIYPLTGEGQAKVLEIAKKDIVPDERYYVDFRVLNSPFDQLDSVTEYPTNTYGIGIQSAMTQTFLQENPFYIYSGHSQLLDRTPNSVNNEIDDFKDARLVAANQQFVDNVNGITVRLESISNQKATVYVDFAGEDPGNENLISIRAKRKVGSSYLHINLFLRNLVSNNFEKVKTFMNASTGYDTYSYVDSSDNTYGPEDVRVTYTKADPNELDNTNYLELSWLEINHQQYLPTQKTYSNGSWNKMKGKCEPGYPKLETQEFEFPNRLSCPEKYFQFSVPTNYPQKTNYIAANAQCGYDNSPEVTITWTSDANAQIYTLDYCKGATCFPSINLGWWPEDNPVNGSVRFYLHYSDPFGTGPPPPQAGKTYKYRVRAKKTLAGGDVYGPWSDTVTIQIPNNICGG